MRERRFWVAPEDLGSTHASIRGAELRHLVKVLRLGPGDEAFVFDGEGHGRRGVIESVDANRAVVVLSGEEDPSAEPALRVTLACGILHGERMDWAIEKATEIGVMRIQGVTSERGMVKPPKGGWGKMERWRRVALAAAKQSGRLRIPEIPAPVFFDEALAAAAREGGARLVFHPGYPLPPAGAKAGSAWLLVGPEGGWSDAEVERAVAAGFTPAGLGGTTLRGETAAVVAAALVLLGGSGEIARL